MTENITSPITLCPSSNLTNLDTSLTHTHANTTSSSLDKSHGVTIPWPPGAVLEELVAGDPDVRRRRGLDVHERGALAGGKRRQPAREHVAVARLVDPPHLAVELGDADVELVDRLEGPVGHRHRVPVVHPVPLRPRRRRVLLDFDGRGVFSSCYMHRMKHQCLS
jgi:hypothetical protein